MMRPQLKSCDTCRLPNVSSLINRKSSKQCESLVVIARNTAVAAVSKPQMFSAWFELINVRIWT